MKVFEMLKNLFTSGEHFPVWVKSLSVSRSECDSGRSALILHTSWPGWTSTLHWYLHHFIWGLLVKQLLKSRFWSALNLPIDVGNSCKLKQLLKSRFWSALNWPIDVGNSCNPQQLYKHIFIEINYNHCAHAILDQLRTRDDINQIGIKK
jgi:hypothetical protein